jgi:hypothetical protein
MIADDDYYARAVSARAAVPARVLWAMMKSQLYLALGFAGATVAAIALRLLLVVQQTHISPLKLALTAVVGIAVTVLVWYRAGRVLEVAADETQSSDAGRAGPPVSVLLGGYSRG